MSSDYLQRLVVRCRPDSTTAFVPNANHYASRGAELEADPASVEPVGADRAPDIESTARAREVTQRTHLADRPDSGRSQAMTAGAPATMPPPAAADRAAVRPMHNEAGGVSAPAATVRGMAMSPGSSARHASAADPAEARPVPGMPPGPADRQARANMEAPMRAADRDGVARMEAPVPLAQAPDLSSPGGHALPTGDAQRRPKARSDRRAVTLPPADVDRAVGQALADEVTGAEPPRTVLRGEAAVSWPAHRESTASDPASAPAGRFHPRANGEVAPHAGPLAPEISSLPGGARLPRAVPTLSLPPRASGSSTSEVRPAPSRGVRSMTPVDSRAPPAAVEETRGRMAGAAPQSGSVHEPTRSRSIGLEVEPGRAAAVMLVRSGQLPRRAGETAEVRSAAPAPAYSDGGGTFKAPIVPAATPEPRRLLTAAASAEPVSITIGSVEFRAPPAPAPAIAARVAAVATPRLSLDEYLRNRRSR